MDHQESRRHKTPLIDTAHSSLRVRAFSSPCLLISNIKPHPVYSREAGGCEGLRARKGPASKPRWRAAAGRSHPGKSLRYCRRGWGTSVAPVLQHARLQPRFHALFAFPSPFPCSPRPGHVVRHRLALAWAGWPQLPHTWVVALFK